MPFRSRSQLRKFAVLVRQGKMSEKEFKKWIKETPDIKSLPERKNKKKKKKRKRRKKNEKKKEKKRKR